VDMLYNPGIMIRTMCLRSLSAWLLVLFIPVCQAQQTTAPLSSHAQRIQTKVQALPAGARLTAILKDKTEYHGHLSSVDGAGFRLEEVDLKREIAVSYEDVKKLRNGYGGMNHAVGHHVDPVRSRIAMCAVFGALILLVVLVARDKS
jgi:hypothetical protein